MGSVGPMPVRDLAEFPNRVLKSFAQTAALAYHEYPEHLVARLKERPVERLRYLIRESADSRAIAGLQFIQSRACEKSSGLFYQLAHGLLPIFGVGHGMGLYRRGLVKSNKTLSPVKTRRAIWRAREAVRISSGLIAFYPQAIHRPQPYVILLDPTIVQRGKAPPLPPSARRRIPEV